MSYRPAGIISEPLRKSNGTSAIRWRVEFCAMARDPGAKATRAREQARAEDVRLDLRAVRFMTVSPL
jgi:hypothetical protein